MLNTSTGSLGRSDLELFENVQPTAVRHRDVENNHVPRFGPDLVQDLLPVDCLAGDRYFGYVSKNLYQPLPHNRMVVGDESPYHRASYPLMSGSLITTVVPRPGVPWMEKSPERSRTRSRIPSKPKDREPSTSLAMMPRPLS